MTPSRPRPDLSVRRQRKALPARRGSYYETLSVGRALGYEKANSKRSYWVARYRNRDGGYGQNRLGVADTHCRADGADVLSYEQAIEAAAEWFETPAVRKLAISTRPLGQVTSLAYERTSDDDGPYTVGDALAEWFAWKRLVATNATYHCLLTSANLNIVPRLAHLPAEGVNGQHVRAFVEDMLRTPPKRGQRPQAPKRAIEALSDEEARKRKKTINGMISVVRGALLMAWESGRIDNERAYRCWRHVPNVHRPRILHLSRPECRALLAACEPELRQVVLGALYTGCRTVELLRMRARDVGRDGYGVYVEPQKSYKPRFVFLPDEGMAFFLALADGKAPGDLLFTRSDGRAWRYNMKVPFKRAVREAGLPDAFTFHGLRHTYASQLVQSGAPLIVVAEQLGHATINTVANTYGHLAPQIREAEVRQRFTMVDEETSWAAAARRDELTAWRRRLHGGDWLTYADIGDLRSVDGTSGT